MSEKLLFGFLRIVRLFVGIWGGTLFLGVLFGIGSLAHIYDQPGRLMIWLIQLGLLAVSAVGFYGLRQLIHMLHRQSFGAPHPKLLTFFSL